MEVSTVYMEEVEALTEDVTACTEDVVVHTESLPARMVPLTDHFAPEKSIQRM